MPASSQRYSGIVRRYYEAEYTASYYGRKHRHQIMPGGFTQDTQMVAAAHNLAAQGKLEQMTPEGQRYWKLLSTAEEFGRKLIGGKTLSEVELIKIHDRANIDAFIQLGREGDIKYRERWLALGHLEGTPPDIVIVHYRGKGEGPMPDDQSLYVEFDFTTAERRLLQLTDDLPLSNGQPSSCMLHVYFVPERWPGFDFIVETALRMHMEKAFA